MLHLNNDTPNQGLVRHVTCHRRVDGIFVANSCGWIQGRPMISPTSRSAPLPQTGVDWTDTQDTGIKALGSHPVEFLAKKSEEITAQCQLRVCVFVGFVLTDLCLF